jgi:nucleoid DNA-binding protein
MMIQKHISDLLYRYQCVTVPGFGAFIAETESAKVNESTATFIAPRKVISFNVNIKNNDGLLANHISLQENLSFEAAVEKINTQVTLWIATLNQGNLVDFPNIGEIKVNGAESNWVFVPSNSLNYLTSSFGLSNFTSNKITREVLKQQVEELEEKAPIIFTPERKKNYSFLKYAAVIAIFIGAGTAGTKIVYDRKIEAETLLVQKHVQEQVQNSIQEATFFINTPVQAVELNVAEEKMPYHIVAGAFRSTENAEKALNMLIEQNFKAHILPENKHGLIPVVYGSYKTIEEAETEKQKIRLEYDSEAWLLIE